MKAQNPYEQAARGRKLLKLVNELDAQLNGAKLPTHTEYSTRLVRAFSKDDWKRIAAAAGCNEPSPDTVADLIALYDARARRAAS